MTSPVDSRGAARPSARWDWVAAGLSSACLIHCVGLPLLIAMLPAASDLMASPDWVHGAALALAFPTSSFALLRGYRHHGAVLPGFLGATGLSLLMLGLVYGDYAMAEAGLTIAGSVALLFAHVGNWRLARLPRES